MTVERFSLKFACIPFIITVLAGCAASAVNSTTTVFYLPEFKPEGTIFVRTVESGPDMSLESAHYKRLFEAKLAESGYTVVNGYQEADFIAYLTYGIDDGTTTQVSIPIYGVTSGGTSSVTQGTINTVGTGTLYGAGSRSNVSLTTYSMPTYGVVGTSTGSVTTYSRVIAFDVVDTNSLLEGAPVRVFESRARSIGWCGQISEVFDEILEAMFLEFPGENAKSRQASIVGEFNC